MRHNLLSIPCLDEKGFEVHFHSRKVSIGKHGRILMQGNLIDGLYYLNIFSTNNESALVGPFTYIDDFVDSSYIDDCSCIDKSYVWHMRLGHINQNKIKGMINMGLIPNIIIDLGTCEPCISNKMTMLLFSKEQRFNESLATIYGPLNIRLVEAWNILLYLSMIILVMATYI